MKAETTKMVAIHCGTCNTPFMRKGEIAPVVVGSNGEPRLPFGWKRFHGKPICRRCRSDCWTTSGVWIPIASIDIRDAALMRDRDALLKSWATGDAEAVALGVCRLTRGEKVDEEAAALFEKLIGELSFDEFWQKKLLPQLTRRAWADFKLAISIAWQEVARISNWAVRALYTSDVDPEPGAKRLPEWKAPDLYRQAHQKFPNTATATLVQILQTVTARYSSRRFESLLCNRRALETYAMQHMALPIKSKTWDMGFEGDVPWIAARIGDRRFKMRLDVGKGSARAIEALRRVVAGEHERTLLTIVPQTRWSNRGDGVETRAAGGQFGKKRLHPQACITIWRPRGERIETADELLVETGMAQEFFIRATMPSGRQLHWHRNDLRGRIAGYARWCQQMANDKKAERRRPKRQTRMMRDCEIQRAAKMNRALNTACHQISASIVGLAVRNGMGSIRWDGRKCGWMSSFPFSKLETMISDKAKQAGILFVNQSEVDDDNGDTKEPV